MKTLITLSSILAAGTLAVNAATSIELADTSTKNMVAWSNSYYSRNFQAMEFTLEDLGFEAEAQYAIKDIGFGLRTYSSPATATNVAILDSNDFILGLSGNVATLTGQIWSIGVTGKSYSHYTFATETNPIILNSSETYTVVFLSGITGITVGEKFTSSNGGSSIANISNGDNILTSKNNQSTLYTTGTADTEGVSFSSPLTQDASNLGVIYFIDAFKATVIPEPSAFGLLAGIGALALAGTRRRRKAK